MKEAAQLPAWVPLEAWAGYLDMRKKIKKPMTERAVQLALASLQKLVEQGQDAGAVLDQSVMNSWQGLFAIVERRAEQRQDSGRRSFPALGKHGQATANNLQDWLEDFV